MPDLFGTSRDPFGKVVGQRSVIDRLKKLAGSPVHAYMLVGMEGVGKFAAAEGFAAALVCEAGDGPCGECWHCEAIMDERHPDVNIFQREGASLTVGEARDVGTWSLRSPSVATKRVIILPDFHLAEGSAPALLKSLEEPPPSTVFVILANSVPSSMKTIASRCVVVELDPLSRKEIEEALIAEGAARDAAANIAALSSGNIARARRLISDPEALSRMQLWRSVPMRLEPHNGASVVAICEELVAAVDKAVSVVDERQSQELKQLGEAKKQKVATKTEETELEKAHKRQRRRIRTDELRTGLAAMTDEYLSTQRRAVGGYSSDEQLPNGGPRPGREGLSLSGSAVAKSAELIRATSESLARNPVESLALQALLIRLGDILGSGT